MRICASCGEAYPEEAAVCELDGTMLSSWTEATRVALGPDDEPISARPTPDVDDELTSERPTFPVLVAPGDGAHGDDYTLPESPQARRRISTPHGHSALGSALAGDPLDVRDSGAIATDVRDPSRDSALGDETTDVASPSGETGVHAGIDDVPSSEEDTLHPTQGPPRPGRILGGRYRLRRRMAVGGFGAVFAAEDLRLHRPVAVKVLSPHIANSREHLARFGQEAIAASQIGHDGIVDVRDFDRDVDGTHFIVMELLDGHDLSQLIATEGPLPVETALAITAQVASALDCAHRCGIVHRDLKPANVFMTSRGSRGDVVKVLDFGISKVMHRRLGAGNLTESGQVVGTPYYMAPEQAQGKPDVDGRADVYALGVMLYEMLTGAPPFTGDHYVVVALQHLTLSPPAPSRARPGLPASVDPLVMQAMAKEPTERFATMAHFHAAIAAELRRLDAGPPGEAAAPGPAAPVASLADDDGDTTEEWSQRRRRVSTLPYSAGQVAVSGPRPAPRQRRRRIAAAGLVGLAGVAVAGAIAAVIAGLGGERIDLGRAAVLPAAAAPPVDALVAVDAAVPVDAEPALMPP
jgi:serine/threonine protein kinase